MFGKFSYSCNICRSMFNNGNLHCDHCLRTIVSQRDSQVYCRIHKINHSKMETCPRCVNNTVENYFFKNGC